MTDHNPRFAGMHFFVRDMKAALAFYSLLGFEPSRSGDQFAHIDLPDGLFLEFGTYALTRGYDSGWTEPTGTGTNALQFRVSGRDAVDDLYARIVAAGHIGRLAPFDAFWGARYAEVRDPDGNVVGFHSPSDDALRTPPP